MISGVRLFHLEFLSTLVFLIHERLILLSPFNQGCPPTLFLLDPARIGSLVSTAKSQFHITISVTFKVVLYRYLLLCALGLPSSLN